MKIKGVIEDFKILKSLKKRMIVKIVDISRTFSGVVDSVGSLYFQIVP